MHRDLQESCPARNSHVSLYVIREHMLTMGKQRGVEVFMAAVLMNMTNAGLQAEE